MPRFRYCELWSDVKCNGGVREYLIPNRYLVKAGYRKALDVPEGGFVDIASEWFDPPTAAIDNLSPRAEELDNAAWTKNQATASANTDTAPDGTATADRLVEDATASVQHRAYSATVLTIGDGANVTISRFLKAGTRTWALLGAIDTTESKGARVYFNLATGEIGATLLAPGVGQSVIARGIETDAAWGAGWYRCWVVVNMGAGVTSIRHYLGLASGNNGQVYSGDGASYVIAWGAQTRVGQVPGKYVRTLGVAASDPLTKRTGPASTAVRKGKVIRFCTTDSTVFDEWRVMDVFDGNGPGPRVTHVVLEPISADGNRAIFTDFDATGQPYHDYRSADATAEQVIDDAILPALADAGVDYVAKGDVELANAFDFAAEDGDTATAMLQRAADADHANAETRWRRNGTTNYLIDVLDEIGSDAPIVHVRTRRNLERWRRHKNGALGFNRVRPIGQDDGTHRGIGYAFFKISVSGNVITLSDPRITGGGGSSLDLLPFDDQLNGLYIQQLGPTLIEAQITATDAANNRVTVDDATGFTTGSYAEFRLAAGANAPRIWYLDDPAQQAIDGGVYLRTFESKLGTGAANYMPDPLTTQLFANPWEVTQAGTISTSTSSDDVLGTGTTFTDMEPGMRLIRDSDSELIGVILSITDDENLVLEANASIALTDEAYATQQPLPLGWSITSDGVPILSGVAANTVPGATAFSAVFTSAGNATTTFETGIPLLNKDGSWRIWSWLDFISLAGTVVVTVSIRNASGGALIGTALTFNTAQHNATRQLAEFVGQNISAATSGVRMRIAIVGTGSHSWNIRMGPLGAAPSAWVRQDVYGPLQTFFGKSAADLWYEAQNALDESGAPEGYELELRDLERAGGLAAEELVVGGTLSVYDTDLDVTTLQRIKELDVVDVWQPLLTRVRVGTRNETLAEIVAKRTKPDTGAVGRALASALTGAVNDGLVTDREQALASVPVLDSGGTPTGDVVNVGVSRLASAIAPALTKSLKRYR